MKRSHAHRSHTRSKELAAQSIQHHGQSQTWKTQRMWEAVIRNC